MLKDALQAPYIPPNGLYQHNLGVFKISLAEVTYLIQDSQIGDWELANKNLALSNDGEGCIKSLTRFDLSSQRPWVRAPPPGELQSRRVNSP
jgi:hypothetical protein